MSGGGVRDSIESGDITYKDVLKASFQGYEEFLLYSKQARLYRRLSSLSDLS